MITIIVTSIWGMEYPGGASSSYAIDDPEDPEDVPKETSWY